MKNIFFSFLFLMCGILLFPQAVQAQFGMGFSAGATYNKLYTKEIRTLEKYKAEAGFSVSIPMQYFAKDWLAIGWDLSCMQKNYAWQYGTFSFQTTRNTYIQLPVMLRFRLFKIKQFKTFINAGGFGGYWVYSRVNGTILNVYDTENGYSYNEKSEFDQRRDQRIEMGLLAGISMEYWLKNQCRFFLEARYYYGATDLQQKNYMINQIPRYNDAFLFQMGCLFNLKKNSKF